MGWLPKRHRLKLLGQLASSRLRPLIPQRLLRFVQGPYRVILFFFMVRGALRPDEGFDIGGNELRTNENKVTLKAKLTYILIVLLGMGGAARDHLAHTLAHHWRPLRSSRDRVHRVGVGGTLRLRFLLGQEVLHFLGYLWRCRRRWLLICCCYLLTH